jgi:hypothetical protein
MRAPRPGEVFANKPTKKGGLPNLVSEAIAAGAFVKLKRDDTFHLLYLPASAKARAYHASTLPNLLMEGRRGTGKSHCARYDFHMRALSDPGYTYLILRRTMPELRKTHLLYVPSEMESFNDEDGQGGNVYLRGTFTAQYGNGSVGLFGHCETEADIEKYLGGQFCAIFFDEITTFPWEWVTKISSSARVEEGSHRIAIVRGGTNPIGVSAEEVHRYFIEKDVIPEEDPDYNPNDWGNIHLEREDNPYLDFEQYDRRFAGLPAAYRKAWVDGQWGVEGAYFSVGPQHLVSPPLFESFDKKTGQRTINVYGQPIGPRNVLDNLQWLHVYRVIDWGWHDPTVCLWVAVTPAGRLIPFREMTWLRTPVDEVANDIKAASAGMSHIVTTFADPTLWDGQKEMGHCLADEFEDRGIALTKAKNDRTAAGLAIQEYLTTKLADGKPKLQMYVDEGDKSIGVPTLNRTLRAMRVDKKKPGRIADHRADHFPICLGYVCMAGVGPSPEPSQAVQRRWMVDRTANRGIIGNGAVSNRRRY